MVTQFLAVHHQAKMIHKGSHQERVSVLLGQRDVLGISASWVMYCFSVSTASHQNQGWGEKCIKQLPLQHPRRKNVAHLPCCKMQWVWNQALLPPIHFVLSHLSRKKRNMPCVTVCKKRIESCNLTSRTIKGKKKTNNEKPAEEMLKL